MRSGIKINMIKANTQYEYFVTLVSFTQHIYLIWLRTETEIQNTRMFNLTFRLRTAMTIKLFDHNYPLML